MNFKQALAILATGGNRHAKRDAAIVAVTGTVRPLCKTGTGANDDSVTTLSDWIANGSFTGDETAQSIAEEWDSLDE